VAALADRRLDCLGGVLAAHLAARAPVANGDRCASRAPGHVALGVEGGAAVRGRDAGVARGAVACGGELGDERGQAPVAGAEANPAPAVDRLEREHPRELRGADLERGACARQAQRLTQILLSLTGDRLHGVAACDGSRGHRDDDRRGGAAADRAFEEPRELRTVDLAAGTRRDARDRERVGGDGKLPRER